MNEYINIKLQEGPIKENGVNGCQVDDLIAYAIEVLQKFQQLEDGKYKCNENRMALKYLGSAKTCLETRTKRRELAGVEGESKPGPGDEGFKEGDK